MIWSRTASASATVRSCLASTFFIASATVIGFQRLARRGEEAKGRRGDAETRGRGEERRGEERRGGTTVTDFFFPGRPFAPSRPHPRVSPPRVSPTPSPPPPTGFSLERCHQLRSS